MDEPWVEIAKVRSVNPGRREIRLSPVAGLDHALAGTDWLWIERAGGPPLKCRVDHMRDCGGGQWLAGLAAGVPRDRIGAMRGAAVLMREADLPEAVMAPLATEDLPGLEVRCEDGALLGTVTDVYSSRARDVAVITRPEGGSVLLPMIPEVVLSADLEAGVLEVGDIGPYAVEEPG